MVIERKFIGRGTRDVRVREYLAGHLERSDFSSIEIRRTPLNTRVIIHAGRPGIIIGRAGSKIKELTDTLQKRFGLENPIIEVKAIERPELDAKIVAKQIADALERGIAYRKLATGYLQRVMEAGAIGIEIVITGKLGGERARSERFVAGYIKKCGEPAEKYVDRGVAAAILKAGMIGVRVSIMNTLPSELLLERKIRDMPTEKKAVAEGAVETQKEAEVSAEISAELAGGDAEKAGAVEAVEAVEVMKDKTSQTKKAESERDRDSDSAKERE